MKNGNGHLPIYGVGPFYGIGIILLTIIGVVLSAAGIPKSGKVSGILPKTVMIVLGILLAAEGFFVWKAAALGKNSIDGYIKKNILCTTGVYSIVRNPCYSGIMLMCSGGLLIAHNLWLLILPVFYWAAMTVLMKCTEEKWLKELYRQEYIDYCKNVNRCIPWFPRKK